MSKIDLRKLDPKTQYRVRRLLRPRDTVLSLRFNAEDLHAWKAKARRENKTLTEKIEELLNRWRGR